METPHPLTLASHCAKELTDPVFFFLPKNIFLAILVFSYSFHVQSKTSVGGNAGENGTVRPKAQSSGSQTQGAALSVGKQEHGTDTAPQPGRESSPVAHSHQGMASKTKTVIPQLARVFCNPTRVS